MRTRRVNVPIDFYELSECEYLAEVITLLSRKLDTVPHEFRDRVEFSLCNEWHEGWKLEVAYQRPETELDRQNDERARREEEAKRHAREYVEFQKLKAKYEP